MNKGSTQPRPNAAIYYHPDGFDTSVSRLMGRQAAGEGFLRAWVRHGGQAQLACYVEKQQHAEQFAAQARAAGWPGGEVLCHGPAHWAGLETIGTLALPGPGLGEFAWHRRMQGREAGYSIVGVTHTTASMGAMDTIGGMLTAPLRPWDALICTSRSVVDTVRTTLANQMAYLRERLPGATAPELPRIAMIPLGVETERFAADPAARAAWRDRLGIGPDDIAVLFVGRLSFHAKAQIVPFYQALQKVARDLPPGRRLHLVEAGWFANDAIRQAYEQAGRDYAPDVTRHAVDGRDPASRYSIWQAGDIFCSLSDNIQETFGLTPIEAMAAGLPVVVSDWDGYRDTVRDGVDGFRIPTIAPPPGLSEDLAYRHATGIDNYDFYCGQTCQFVVVDIDATARAIGRLAVDPELRARMGRAARDRAHSHYDWRHVIGWYQTLYAELAEIRAAAVVPAAATPRHPLRADPFHSFASYPTRRSRPDDIAHLCAGADAAAVALLRSQASVGYAVDALPADMLVIPVLDALAGGPQPVGNLLLPVPSGDKARVWRGILWLEKHGLLRTTPAGQS